MYNFWYGEAHNENSHEAWKAPIYKYKLSYEKKKLYIN